MRGVLSIAVILGLAGAARAETALDALKQIPKDQAARIARIEGRGGMPDPDRWYILTQDPAADNGVHEFVVSNGVIIASRSLSQFADSLKPDEILGDEPLGVDTDKLAKLAHDYAAANGAAVAGINYELKKDGPGAAPAWTVSCVDDKGNTVGQLLVTADKGDLVSHEGFALEPAPETTPLEKKPERARFQTYAKPEVAVAEVNAATPSDSPADDEPDGRHGKRPAQKQPGVIGKTLQSVGKTLEKLNPF
jgi:hypothetical protein